jgi:hypothetical protein
MKTYGEVDVYIHVYLTLALDEEEWSVSRIGCFTRGEIAPGAYWIGGSVGPSNGLDSVVLRKICCTCWQSYNASILKNKKIKLYYT